MKAVLVATAAVCLLAGVARGEASAAPVASAMANVPARAGALTGPVVASDRSAHYSDAVGDTDIAPDVSRIVVNSTGSRLTFQVGIANLGPGLVNDEFVAVLIDADRNANTGCDGAEFALAVLGDTGGSPAARPARCVGNNFKLGGLAGFSYSESPGIGIYGPGAITFGVNASAIGTTHFKFEVDTDYAESDDIDTAGPFSFGSASSAGNPPGRPGSSSKGIVITRHAGVRAEATGPTGARVTYAPARVRGAKTVSYSKRSGTIFRLGRTTVAITARNGARVSRSSFVVIVADTTPPTLNPLPSVGTNATDPTRATVTFGPVTATDRVDRNVSVTCAPPSGSVLAPGATSVSCTARDDAGNATTSVFRVAVPVFATQMSLQTNTTYQYDGARRLVGATTALTIAVPAATDGSPTTYAWAASTGTITGNGPTATWTRQVDATGQPAASSVNLTLTFASGRTEVRTIQFP